MSEATTNTADNRGTRRTIIGTVTSSTMDKTVVVTVVRRVRDRRFHKFLTNRQRYKAHDEHNTCKVGDLVEIQESRPLSRTKRWRLLRLITRAVEQVGEKAESDKGVKKS
ncbi:MAG: 30S ribosomal protein S17 [Proteobacteria bacterium]|nr:30S ribosomal protein S17 [Pseudomonadota bacterium]